MPVDLLSAIQSGRVLLADGAMGTQLQAEGLPPGVCGELWNVEQPDKVRAIQLRYRDAGSDMVLTNTFGGSSLALNRHGLAERARELNRAAARIARKVMGEDRWVLGDIGPFGGMLDPYGDADPDDVFTSFRDQAAALLDGGADAIIVETMQSMEEMDLAVRAAHEAGASLIIASMAFNHAGGGSPRTMMGTTPDVAAAAMIEAGAGIVGCNCGTNLSPDDYVEIVRLMKAAAGGRPVIAQPNAGMPELTPTGIVYRESAEKMAAWISRLIDTGASILGGCCGTSPRHIALFRGVIDGRG